MQTRKPLPLQPVYKDKHGVMRFQENIIVRHLLDHGGIDLNALAAMGFPKEDWMQFAQLIGYSISGFGELNYVDSETFYAASVAADGGNELEARIQYHRELLHSLRMHLREPMAELFKRHPADLYDAGDSEDGDEQ